MKRSREVPDIVKNLLKIDVTIGEETYTLDAYTDLSEEDVSKNVQEIAAKYMFVMELVNMLDEKVETKKFELEVLESELDREARIAGIKGETRINRDIIRNPRFQRKSRIIIANKKKFNTLRNFAKALEMQLGASQSLLKFQTFVERSSGE